MTETIRSYGVILKSTGKKTVRAQIVQQGRSYSVFDGETLICETDTRAEAHEAYNACFNRLMSLKQNQPPLFL